MTIYDLNEKYFELYSRLNDNREFVSTNAYKAMSKALDKMYDEELTDLTGALALDTAEAAFIRKYRIRRYIPRRGLFGYNRIGKAFMQRCKADFKAYLAAILDSDVNEPPEDEVTETPEETSEETSEEQSTALIVPGRSEIAVKGE